MSHRIWAAVIAAAFFSAGLLAIPSAASAEDHRPCVSQVEYQSTPGAIRLNVRARGAVDRPSLTRKELEKRWDVEGQGTIDREYSDNRSRMWVYRACGYALGEGEIWAIAHGPHGYVVLVARWLAPHATSHGYTREG